MIRSRGEKRFRISFQSPTARRATGSGYVAKDYTTWRENEWAKREEVGGTESMQAGGRQEALRVLWTVDFSTTRNPTTKDVIVHRNSVFNIDAVNDPDGMERQLEIQSTQVAVIANA